MINRAAASERKTAFILRVSYARMKKFDTQEGIADALGINQAKYHKYEGRSYLPHELIPLFCQVCEITIGWLFNAVVTDEMRSFVEARRRPRAAPRAKRKKAA